MTETTIYARDAELGRLDAALDEAIAGRGGVLFVSGEAGTGKTALLAEFGRLATAKHEDLVCAFGSCDAQTGEGDAYLPFREIMQQLTGDVEAHVAQGRVSQAQAKRLLRFMIVAGETLVELAPDLIGVVVPGAALLGRIGKVAAGKTRWAEKLKAKLEHKDAASAKLEKAQVYEQYANVLQHLSKSAPLLLVVDDLQWADTASLGLLFRLARRLAGGRVLLVCLYRPNDLATAPGGERHPLVAVLSEVKRYHGDVTLDLDATVAASGPTFVSAWLDREPNRLDATFRDGLLRHTGGHPLFVIELLRDLEERGDIYQDESGSWVAAEGLAWGELPSKVEGVIEERINRLDEHLVRSLTIGSVEGPQFTAEAVAKVQPSEPRELITSLSETLQRRHRLIEAVGMTRVGKQRLSHYAFTNQLLHSYLYDHLDEAEASYLHEDVGLALESLYGDDADQIAVQLARHFDVAGVPDKARRYLLSAARQAEAAFAHEQAAAHYRRALSYVSDAELADRYDILLALVEIDDVLADRTAGLADLEMLADLASRLGDRPKQAQANMLRAKHELESGDNEAAVERARMAVELVEATEDDRGIEAGARRTWGRALLARSRPEEAKEQLRRGLVLARLSGDLVAQARVYGSLGIALDVTGQWLEAREYFSKAVAAHEAAGNRLELGGAYMNLGVSNWRRGDLERARELLQQATDTFREVGDRDGVGKATANLAIILCDTDPHAARRLAEEALEINREVASPYAVARTLGAYAAALTRLGELAAARAAEREALAIDLETGDRQDEVYRRAELGEVALALGEFDEAERELDAARAVAEEIGELSAEGQVRALLATLHTLRGDARGALEHAVAARDLAEGLGNDGHLASRLVHLGWAYLGAGDEGQVEACLDRAKKLLDDSESPGLRALRVALATSRGDSAAAMAAAEPIVDGVIAGSLGGTLGRFRVMLSVLTALEAVGDARATALRSAARGALDAIEAGLEDPAARQRFRAHPVHRALTG